MTTQLTKRGLAIIITGPSGVGKGTVISSLLSDCSLGIVGVVRHTSRSPRLGETMGKENHFVSPKKFSQLVAKNAFLEWNQVGDHFYGTTLDSYRNARAESQTIVFDVGVSSAMQLGEALKDYDVEIVTVFLSPIEKELLSSREGVLRAVEILENRIHRRSVLKTEEVSDRLREGEESLGQVIFFKHVVACKEGLLDEAVSAVKILILNNGQVP